MAATTTTVASTDVGVGASTAPAWRQLPFYDPSPVRDAADGGAPSPSALRSANRIAALCVAPVTPQLPPPDADQVAVTATQENGSSTPSLKSGQPCVLLADIDGFISVLHWRSYAPLAKWLAHPAGRVTHLAADSVGRVITLGEEEASRFPVLRAWDLGKLQGGAAWAPRLLSQVRVQHGSRPHPIAALAHTPSLSYLSLALADGSVLLLRSLDAALQSAAQTTPVPLATPDSAPTPALTLPKFKVIFQPSSSATTGSEPVTALGFAETTPWSASLKPVSSSVTPSRRRARAATTNVAPPVSATPAPTSVQLFIVTLARTLRYNVLGTGAGAPAAVVDDVGCALGCGAIVPGSSSSSSTTQGALAGKMVVARDEAVYVVGSEGREVCLAYEGPKAAVHLSSTQLVIVSPPLPASAASASATVRNFVSNRDREQQQQQQQRGLTSPLGVSPAGSGGALSARAGLNGAGALGRRGSAPTNTEVAKVTVFDLDNKLVAYSGTFEGGVRLAWTGPQGEVCVLGDDGSLTRLEEKALRAKLDLLFRKNLFLLAVNVARSHAARWSESLSLTSGMPGSDVEVAPASIEALLGDIFRKYGDHLYAKGDFEGAMAQFVKTIGVTQPSYVIRKFLDAQRINNLTTYLQELHARGMANSDHTTLLLNCYTKLKDVASLDRFIKRPPTAAAATHVDEDGPDADEGGSREELPFDLATAMRVCRQAGYYGHAAYLAKRYGEHDEYMRIQLEDARDFDDALAYLRSLSPHEAELHLQRYGKLLLAERPEATTDLLIELCSGAFHPKPSAVGTGVEAAQAKSVAAAYLAYLQVGSYGKVATTSPGAPAQTSTSTPMVQPTTSERTSVAVEPYSLDGEAASSHAQAHAQAYTTPSPRLFFAHFIRHPSYFVRFLETVALARWGQSVDMEAHAPSHEPLSALTALAPLATPAPGDTEEQAKLALQHLGMEPGDDAYEDEERADQRAIWNTLLELYLASSREPASHIALPHAEHGLDGAQRTARRERALHLLEQHEALPYDITQALVLCSVESFTEGLVLLYERLGMYEDVLRFWMDASEENHASSAATAGVEDATHSSRVMAALWRYGPVCPHLYPMVLRYLVSTEAILARHHDDVTKVLEHIEEHDLMGPLEVVQALGRSGVATVGMVREHLTRAVLQEREEIEADRRLIASYRSETAKKSAEVAELSDVDAPRVFQLTRCTACSGQLDLPSVHFMCKHSYHQRCLGENEAECPNCARAHGVIREIRRGNEALGDRHELFMQELQEAEDGFDAASVMFSKGLLSGRLAAVGQADVASA